MKMVTAIASGGTVQSRPTAGLILPVGYLQGIPPVMEKSGAVYLAVGRRKAVRPQGNLLPVGCLPGIPPVMGEVL